jgi:hypothetical protein
MDFPVLGFAFLFARAPTPAAAERERERTPGEMLICIFQSCAGNHFIFYVTQLWRAWAHAAPKLGDAEKMPLSSPRFLFCARCGPVWHAPDEGSASINTRCICNYSHADHSGSACAYRDVISARRKSALLFLRAKCAMATGDARSHRSKVWSACRPALPHAHRNAM